MKLLLCNCHQCRHCRKFKHNKLDITQRKRCGRRKVRQLLHVGEYELLPIAIVLPYYG